MDKTVLKRLSIGLAALAVVFLLGACSAKSSNRVTVTTAVSARGTVVKSVNLSGILAPDQTVNIFSELGGYATRVTAAVGDPVKAGSLLVQIDDRQLEAQLEVARAAVQAVDDQAAQAKIGIQTAKANLDLAQKSYARIDSLFKSQAVPRNQMDDARNKLDLAQSAYENAQKQYQQLTGSSLAQAKARVDLIQVQISNSIIRSPLSGVVTNRNVNPGEMVSMAAPVMTISDTFTLKLQGTVAQAEVPLMHMGQKVTVTVDGMPDVTFSGSIIQIGPVAASTGQYFPVVVSLKNDGRLLAGMTAMASFKLTGPERVLLPLSAVKAEGGENFVFEVRNGTVRRVAVELGLANSTQVSIVRGLDAGVTVATSNLGTLQDGMAVTVGN